MRYMHHKMNFGNLQLSQNMEFLNNPTMNEIEIEIEGNDGRVVLCQLAMERRADIVALLLWGAVGFTIPRGAFASIAKEALCSEKAVRNTWTQLKGGERLSEIVIGKNRNKNAVKHDTDIII